jgi:hypothetical protein
MLESHPRGEKATKSLPHILWSMVSSGMVRCMACSAPWRYSSPGERTAVHKRGLRQSEPSPERVMGFEPTTVCLGSRYATTASHPHVRSQYSVEPSESQMPCGTGCGPLLLAMGARLEGGQSRPVCEGPRLGVQDAPETGTVSGGRTGAVSRGWAPPRRGLRAMGGGVRPRDGGYERWAVASAPETGATSDGQGL